MRPLTVSTSRVRHLALALAAVLILAGPLRAAARSLSVAEEPQTKAVVRPAAHALPAERDNWYAIRFDNHLIGFSHFGVDSSVELSGDRFYTINSESRVKLGPGDVNDVNFRGRLLLNQATLAPSLFVCRQAQGKVTIEVQCLFTSKIVAQTNRGNGQETTNTFNVDGTPYLIFNNIWGRVDTFIEHYVVLLSAWHDHGEKDSLTVYEPVLRGTETINIQSQGNGTVSLGGHEVAARQVIISDARQQPLARAWLSLGDGRLLRLEDTNSGFMFSLSDPRVEAMVSKVNGVNLLKNRMEFSNVFFPNATQLRSFKALIDVHVSGHVALKRDIRGYKETFDGQSADGVVKGTVDVSSEGVTVKNSDPYPRRAPYPAAIAAYVQPEPGIESQDDEMHSKGEEIAWHSRTAWEAAEKINAWIHDKVAEGYSMPSGRFVLQHLTGNAESRAMLAVTLLRAINIPARTVGGILFSDGNFVVHNWVEVYVGDDGWVAIDPTTGEAGTLGATHVALWDSGDLSSMDVKVLSFGPRPPENVSFFNREIAWPVGQQRTYSVQHAGKEVGREIATLKRLTTVNGKDAYEMDFFTDTEVDTHHIIASATLLTQPDVLPLQLSVTASVDGQQDSRAFDFTPNAVTESIKVGSDTKTQETPMSFGTYVVDPRFISMYALVVGQLPNPGLNSKATVHVYDPTTHDSQDITLQIHQEEKIGVAGEERDTWRCESTDGVSFFIDKKTSQVVRIEQPRQDIVLQLVESAMKI